MAVELNLDFVPDFLNFVITSPVIDEIYFKHFTYSNSVALSCLQRHLKFIITLMLLLGFLPLHESIGFLSLLNVFYWDLSVQQIQALGLARLFFMSHSDFKVRPLIIDHQQVTFKLL